MENFIHAFQVSSNICDELIQYHKNNTEYKTAGATGGGVDKNIKDSIDVTFFNYSTHSTIRKYFSELQAGYNQYVEKYHIQQLRITAEIAHNVQYYPPGGGFKIWHWERQNDSNDRQLVYMTYLNDVIDGGGTEWLYQNYKTEARKGLTVIWPADFTFTHRGIVAPNEEKWIVTGWFSYMK